jgi:hypothetical protein
MKKQVKKLSELQVTFNFVVEKYITKFVKKHGYEFSNWVSDEIGGIAVFVEQYFFDFNDIRMDIDNNVKKDLIFKWQDDGVEYALKNPNEETTNINFKSYISGLRYSDLKRKDLIVLKNKSKLKIIAFSKNEFDMCAKVMDKFPNCEIIKKGDPMKNSLTEIANSDKNYYQYFKIETKENN